MTGAGAPPGPSVWRALLSFASFRRDPLTFLQLLARRYGDVAMVHLGVRRLGLVSHPDLVKEVLVTRNQAFRKSPLLRRARILLGEGLLTNEGESHLRQRRLAQPAFHRERIAAYGRTMVEHADRLSDEWADGARIDVHRDMMRLTLGIAGQTFFGADVLDEADEIGGALDTVIGLFPRAMIPFAELLDHLPIPSTRRFFAARDRLDDTIYRLIAERRASGEDRGDLLSMLLLAVDAEGDGGGMSDEQLRDEALTILLAGHETTANALAWSWYLLARHREVESRLRAELQDVLGGRLPTAADLPALRYTRAVLSESMRLFPPAWVIGREAVEDFEARGYTIRAGTTIFVSPWVLHRDPRFWRNPERFEPERWLEEADSAPRFAYFPFGGGPRMCIGEGFAWTELTLVLATLAQRWRLRLVREEPVIPLASITLRPRHGVSVRLERVGR